jgi:hypothetical protein
VCFEVISPAARNYSALLVLGRCDVLVREEHVCAYISGSCKSPVGRSLFRNTALMFQGFRFKTGTGHAKLEELLFQLIAAILFSVAVLGLEAQMVAEGVVVVTVN